jgi:hypothetical protein
MNRLSVNYRCLIVSFRLEPLHAPLCVNGSRGCLRRHVLMRHIIIEWTDKRKDDRRKSFSQPLWKFNVSDITA